MASFFYLQILKVKKNISCLSKASAVCLGPLVIVAWNTWGRLFISEGCLYSSHFSGLKSILGTRPDLRCACSSSWDCTGENGFCLCWRVSMAHSFLVRGGSLCPLPALSTGALSLSSLCVELPSYWSVVGVRSQAPVEKKQHGPLLCCLSLLPLSCLSGPCWCNPVFIDLTRLLTADIFGPWWLPQFSPSLVSSFSTPPRNNFPVQTI